MGQKLCPQAREILAGLLRRRDDKNFSSHLSALALVKHVDNCKAGCGRDLEGEPWPP